MISIETLEKQFQQCPTPYHFISLSRQLLKEKGFEEIFEKEFYTEIPKKYFMIQENCNIIIINNNNYNNNKYSIFSSNLDYSVLKIQPKSSINFNNFEQNLIFFSGKNKWWSWLDRNLKLVGQIIYKKKNQLLFKNFDSKIPLLFIPNLAIHFYKELKFKFKENKEIFNPILSLNENNIKLNFEQNLILLEIISNLTNIKIKNIYNFDLSLIENNNKIIFNNYQQNILSGCGIGTIINSLILLNQFLNNNNNNNNKNNILYFYNLNEIESNLKFNNKLTLLEINFKLLNLKNKNILFYHFTKTFNINELNKGIYLRNLKERYCYINSKLYSKIKFKLLKYNIKFLEQFNNNNEKFIPLEFCNLISMNLGIKFCSIGLPVLSNDCIREFVNINDLKELEKLINILL